ncbi:MAG: 2'-deoxycytidine 5'-triphosphate deaminase [Candidatus Roizmanbacteria bacterium]|nr:MAG: 2'-deoxycytidine 5'-triphosphate deaminase [Candidatus Roizmanbacteria bacterium]
MIIGPKKLLELVKENKLVSNLSERELTNPEGAGFDLRLGEVHEISGGRAFLGVTERETPQIKTLVSYQNKKQKSFTFEPGKYYLVSTIEEVNLPQDITCNMKPRTTTFRSGLFLRTGNVAPGYSGKLTFALKNEGPLPVTVELGARIVHAQFYWVDGGGNMYRGQWQGGRVTTKKKETQV